VSQGDGPSEEEIRLAREVTARAIRRLDMLEWVGLAVGAVLATAAGALMAFLFARPLGLPFRGMWIGTALLLFVVSGVAGWIRNRREEQRERDRRDDRT